MLSCFSCAFSDVASTPLLAGEPLDTWTQKSGLSVFDTVGNLARLCLRSMEKADYYSHRNYDEHVSRLPLKFHTEV